MSCTVRLFRRTSPFMVLYTLQSSCKKASELTSSCLASCPDPFASLVFFTLFLFEPLTGLKPAAPLSRSFFRLVTRVCMAFVGSSPLLEFEPDASQPPSSMANTTNNGPASLSTDGGISSVRLHGRLSSDLVGIHIIITPNASTVRSHLFKESRRRIKVSAMPLRIRRCVLTKWGLCGSELRHIVLHQVPLTLTPILTLTQ